MSRSGTYTVAGGAQGNPTSIAVNGSAATLYADQTFAKSGVTLTDGTNTFTAVATDALSRYDTNTVTAYLPLTVAFAYDLNGNLRTNGTRLFDYDDENQLIRVTEAGAWKSEFVYDGKMRRRIRKEYRWQGSAWLQTNEVRYVYDGNLVIQERDALNLPQVTYTRGRDLSGSLEGAGGIGGLLARTENWKLISADPSAHAYYHADGNGNITCLIGTNEAVVARYLYDPFGNVLSAIGPLAEANLYRFSSKEWQPASGLVYYLYRFYDSSLQRWVNRDPVATQMPHDNRPWGNKLHVEVEQGADLYWPFRNDPIANHDPDGRFIPVLVCAIVAGVVVCGCSKQPPPSKDPCPSQWPPFNPIIPKKIQCGALKGACEAACDTVDIDCTVKCATDCVAKYIKCVKGLLK